MLLAPGGRDARVEVVGLGGAQRHSGQIFLLLSVQLRSLYCGVKGFNLLHVSVFPFPLHLATGVTGAEITLLFTGCFHLLVKPGKLWAGGGTESDGGGSGTRGRGKRREEEG